MAPASRIRATPAIKAVFTVSPNWPFPEEGNSRSQFLENNLLVKWTDQLCLADSVHPGKSGNLALVGRPRDDGPCRLGPAPLGPRAGVERWRAEAGDLHRGAGQQGLD